MKRFELFAALLALALVSTPVFAQDKPNIVFIMADNLGYGEIGVYGGGILRGAPTPRIDKLAIGGHAAAQLQRRAIVHAQPVCAHDWPASHSLGHLRVPIDGRPYGLMQWEITLAELLSAQGYATGHFGKWHLGDSEGRYPTDQGFDEWYGIPNSSDESFWPQQTYFDPKMAHLEQVMEGRRGEKSRNVEVYDAEARREIDTEITAKTIDFMKRSVQTGKPFFAYVPFTQVHLPTRCRPSNSPARPATATAPTCWPRWTGASARSSTPSTELEIAGQHHRRVHQRQRSGGGVPVARLGRPVVGLLLHRHGRLPARAVPHPLAGQDPCRPGEQRNRARRGHVHHAGPAGRRRDSHRPGHRRRGPDRLFCWASRRTSAANGSRVRGRRPLRREVAELEDALGLAGADGRPAAKAGGLPRIFNLYITPQERPDESLNTDFRHAWVAHAMFKSLVPFQESLKKYPPIPTGTADPYVMQGK